MLCPPLCLLLALHFVVNGSLSKPSNYCAEIASRDTNGSMGYFSIQIFRGVASYSYNLDLSNLNKEVCDWSQGLLIQMHTKWDSIDTNSSSGPVNCGVTFTGGQYDPNLACGYNSSLCAVLNRTILDYNCSSSIYQRGNYGQCRVGDITGKFGAALPSRPNVFLRESAFQLQDYQPPYISDYAHSNKLTGMWSSIVFRCMDNTRLVCAKLNIVHTGSSSVCPFASPSNQSIKYTNLKCVELSNRRESLTVLSLSAALTAMGCLLMLIIGSLVLYTCHLKSKTVPIQGAI